MTQLKSICKVKRQLCLFLLVIVISPSLMFAGEQAGPQVVTLREVLMNITRNDPSIIEALRQYNSVLAERSIADSEYYPTIGTELSAGPERTNGVPTDDDTENLMSASATLYARQNLYNGGQTTAFVKETDARILAAAYEVLNVANQVYLESAEAYINVVKTGKFLQVAEKNVLTQERILRQVREKTEAGFNRASELYNSESRLALARANYISRQQDLHQALVVFQRQFGRLLRPEQFIRPEPTYQIPETLQETVDVAFHKHPALQVAKYNIQTSRYTYEKAKAAYSPTLDFEVLGNYRSDTGGENGDTNQAGAFLTVNYTFFDGGARDGRKASDKQSLRKEYQRSYIERRNVNETVRLAWNIKEADEFKKDYLESHVALSLKTLIAFKDEYYVGRRTLQDLLNMENEYTDAQLALYESEFSHLIAQFRLMQATGVLLWEYDSGLREMLKLPKEESNEIEQYEDFDLDRDQDQLADISDQCDNSEPHAAVKLYGCTEDEVKTSSYPYDDISQLSPYIAPLNRQPPIQISTP